METCDREEDLGWGQGRGPRVEIGVWSWDKSTGAGARIKT